ncbi:MAG: hypothetical protein AAGI30_08795 [Planctomycetota bacterium]
MRLEDLHVAPGDRVRIRQRIEWGERASETVVEGEVLRVGRQATGSWFAHMPDDKLWLDRIELRKGNGEIVKINLDRNSEVEVIEAGASTDT